MKYLAVILAGFLQSCASIQTVKTRSISQIGCLPEEIKTEIIQTNWAGFPTAWIAVCKNQKFYCNSSANAFGNIQTTCTIELEALPAASSTVVPNLEVEYDVYKPKL